MNEQQLAAACNGVLALHGITVEELARRLYYSEDPRNHKELLIDRAATKRRLGNISTSTLWRLTKAGKLHAVQIGSRRMYRVDEVEDFVKQHTA